MHYINHTWSPRNHNRKNGKQDTREMEGLYKSKIVEPCTIRIKIRISHKKI
jgi:hypothetical protein